MRKSRVRNRREEKMKERDKDYYNAQHLFLRGFCVTNVLSCECFCLFESEPTFFLCSQYFWVPVNMGVSLCVSSRYSPIQQKIKHANALPELSTFFKSLNLSLEN